MTSRWSDTSDFHSPIPALVPRPKFITPSWTILSPVISHFQRRYKIVRELEITRDVVKFVFVYKFHQLWPNLPTQLSPHPLLQHFKPAGHEESFLQKISGSPGHSAGGRKTGHTGTYDKCNRGHSEIAKHTGHTGTYDKCNRRTLKH